MCLARHRYERYSKASLVDVLLERASSDPKAFLAALRPEQGGDAADGLLKQLRDVGRKHGLPRYAAIWGEPWASGVAVHLRRVGKLPAGSLHLTPSVLTVVWPFPADSGLDTAFEKARKVYGASEIPEADVNELAAPAGLWLDPFMTTADKAVKDGWKEFYSATKAPGTTGKEPNLDPKLVTAWIRKGGRLDGPDLSLTTAHVVPRPDLASTQTAWTIRPDAALQLELGVRGKLSETLVAPMFDPWPCGCFGP